MEGSVKHITRIEDLPPAMQKRVKRCLLIYGNAFICTGDDTPVLLHPDKISMRSYRPSEKTYVMSPLTSEDEKGSEKEGA